MDDKGIDPKVSLGNVLRYRTTMLVPGAEANVDGKIESQLIESSPPSDEMSSTPGRGGGGEITTTPPSANNNRKVRSASNVVERTVPSSTDVEPADARPARSTATTRSRPGVRRRKAVQKDRRGRLRAFLYLYGFLALELKKQVIELIANLQPVFSQKSKYLVGKTVSFGQPLVPASLLLSLGISESDFDALGYSIDDTGAKIEDLVALNSLTVSSVPSDYDSAFALARSINEGSIALGACKSDDLSGGLAGSGSEFEQFTCVPLPATTKKEMEKWIDLEEEACRADAFGIDTLLHDCMLFSSHNPGSNYILMGEVSYSMKLSCEYRSKSLKAWNELAVSTVTRLSSPFKYLNEHRLVCIEPFKKSRWAEEGFFLKQRQLIDQDWTALKKELPFVERCDSSSTYSELKKWKGGVQVGAFEIVQWCADCGWDSTREDSCPTQVSAHRCWSKVLGLMDTTTALTWEVVGRSLPQRIIRAAMDGSLRDDMSKFSDFWLEFEEILLAKDITDSVSREVFRSTFGWGFKIMREVVDYSRWVSTETALHNAGLLDPGTQHVIEMRCTESDGTVSEKLDAPANYRIQGLEVVIPPWSKAINSVIIFFVLALSILSMVMPDSRNIHFLLGVGWLIVLPLVWEFELAVSSSVLKACEMRVTATIGGAEGWGVGILYDSIIGRLSVGAVSVSVAQCLCWLWNPRVLSTGMLPKGPSSTLLSLGTLYAIGISIFSTTWWNACSSDHDVHVFDRWLPLFLGFLGAILTGEGLTRSAENNLACHLEEMKTAKDLQHSHWDPYIEEHVFGFKRLLAGTKCDTELSDRLPGGPKELPPWVCFVSNSTILNH